MKMEGKKRDKQYGKRVKSKSMKGKYIKSKIPKNSLSDIAIDATVRAYALKENNKESLHIKKDDLRQKIRNNGAKLSIALIIDLSESMSSDEKLKQVKLILKKIINNAQVNRDKIAVIGFKGTDAEIIIPSTIRPNSFLNKLKNITVGGTTPIADGLIKGLEILKKDIKSNDFIPMVMLLSDGVTNVGVSSKDNFGLKSGFKTNKKREQNPINDVWDIADEIARQDIHTVIVNFKKEDNKGWSVNKRLASITNAKFYDLEQLDDLSDDLSSDAIDSILSYERENI
ncbi:vWA domain-containing protein [Methanobrevibacter sp. DSM 116169]|uniref:vWA domain-containing protein n=1 Tax=Methanobrevibacter sp. DSM 116169 TaxID=3242727 RepID=UPI0038FD0B9D